MSAREEILRRIDQANAERTASDPIADADALLAAPETYRIAFEGTSNLDQFIFKATSETVTATVEMIEKLNDIPPAIEQYVEAKSLAKRIALQPRKSLTDLDWSGFETAETAAIDEPVAVTFADAGIAETGSLVFQTAPDAPVLLNFLPLHHLAIVRKSTIHRYMEDIFDTFGTTVDAQRRSLNIITGTSGTADIEARNVRGAHGPRFMHIFCINDI